MAKCLACGAGNEWIQGRVLDEPSVVQEQADRIIELEGKLKSLEDRVVQLYFDMKRSM